MHSALILDAVAARLARSRRVLFITGAGISADSGLPTYRGVGGLYNGDLTEDGLPIEAVLSGEMLAMRPEITWKYLAQIERTCRGAQPNAAHRAIAALEDMLGQVLVFTQNVDGLHRAAGSRRLIEVHGNLHELRCTACTFGETVADLAGRLLPPACPVCGGLLRPNVVLFGEALPAAAIDSLLGELDAGMDMVFSIGTSGAFPYIAEPVVWAAQAGIPTVEINPQATRLTPYVRHHVQLGAADAMSALMERLAGRGMHA